MPYTKQMLAVFTVCSGLVFLPVFHSPAEELYHWKDQNGISCFSNVSPPDDVHGYSTMRLAPSPALNIASPEMNSDAAAGAKGRGDSDDPAPTQKRLALQERIRIRETSIRTIEALLKTRPNDAELRRCLYQKKQALNEDRIRFKLLSR